MKYVFKKILSTLLTLFAVSFLVFLAFNVISGDPATSMLGTQATPARVEALREELGLNAPFLVRYFRWAASFAAGDMGISYSYHLPVKEMIADKIPVTLTLTAFAFVMTALISIPLGLYAARKEGRRIDHFIEICNQIVMAIPPFFAGILITYLFGRILKLFTPGGYVSYQVNPAGFLGYLLFPALAMALPKAAMTVKLLRGNVIKEAGLDYVRTAYSKGNRTRDVFWRHVLKNAMIPVITFLGMAFTDMLAGSIIIEQVFGIPGLGRILLSSISNRDYPVVEAVIICIAFFIIVTNFLVDLIYRYVDPRITLE